MATTWQTVRIFISSTFRDMHAERDHLARVVFPELRERMAKRHLYLVDLDLRWGITEAEAEQGKVVEIVLDEIKDSRPFFIGILGERYGSVLDVVPDDVRYAHPWLEDYPGHSLTALEIVHGVLRNPELARRSFFYFRDPKFIPEIPNKRRSDYEAESSKAVTKVKALKKEIRASGRPVLEGYPAHWDDGKESIAHLDDFGQWVLEDLWAAICEEYPEEAPEPDPLTVEHEMHEAFAEERSRLHVGREEQAMRLTGYVQGTDRRPAVITGESGCGKSAFLANWVRQYAADNPDDFVLSYFIGASPASTDHFRLLRNMCAEIKRRFDLPDQLPEEDKKLSETLAVLLSAASRGGKERASFADRILRKSGTEGGRRIILLLDALDQLSPLEGAHGLGWLLDYMPEKVQLVVSSLEGDCLDVLKRREAEEIELSPLTPDEQVQIVKTLLTEWRRKLDEKQMAALLSHPAAENPLYLRVAMEELRLFGVFEQLTPFIESLPEDIPGLFNQVLTRLEEDHGKELAREAFTLISCSRYGISESELLELLCREGEEKLPRALWARLARGAGAYLVARGELIDFFHRQMAEAAVARYPEQQPGHEKLASFFKKAALDRRLDEYPYQLQQAEDWQALAEVLSDLDFFKYAWDHDRKYEWMGYWRSLSGRHEPGERYLAAIEAKVKRDGETEEVASLANLAGWFVSNMGLYPAAEPLYKRSLAIREQALGPEHPDVGQSLNNLAALYADQGRYVEAEPLYKRSLVVREQALGPEHPLTKQVMKNLKKCQKKIR